jgi:hypothetical protein
VECTRLVGEARVLARQFTVNDSVDEILFVMASILGGRVRPLTVTAILILWFASFLVWTSMSKFDAMWSSGSARPDLAIGRDQGVNNHGIVRYTTREEYSSFRRFQVGGTVCGVIELTLLFYSQQKDSRAHKRSRSSKPRYRDTPAYRVSLVGSVIVWLGFATVIGLGLSMSLTGRLNGGLAINVFATVAFLTWFAGASAWSVITAWKSRAVADSRELNGLIYRPRPSDPALATVWWWQRFGLWCWIAFVFEIVIVGVVGVVFHMWR